MTEEISQGKAIGGKRRASRLYLQVTCAVHRLMRLAFFRVRCAVILLAFLRLVCDGSSGNCYCCQVSLGKVSGYYQLQLVVRKAFTPGVSTIGVCTVDRSSRSLLAIPPVVKVEELGTPRLEESVFCRLYFSKRRDHGERNVATANDDGIR